MPDKIIDHKDSPYVIKESADGTRTLLAGKWHKGQRAALASRAKITLVLAGHQSGKSAVGPYWLMREMLRCGPGFYLVAAPTHPLLEASVLSKFSTLFEYLLQWGTIRGKPPCLTIHPEVSRKIFGDRHVEGEETKIFFRHATKHEALAAVTAKAALLDEAGQKEFKLMSWEAVKMRTNYHDARILITTTPYMATGWLRNKVYDKRNDPREDIRVINFKSTMNPGFRQEIYDKAVRSGMPDWRLKMFFDGVFEFPAGRIYDIFDRSRHTVKRFPIPEDWRRMMGIDPGDVNMAGVYLARDEASNKYYVYRTYHASSKTIAEHKTHMTGGVDRDARRYEADGVSSLQAEPRPPAAYGGAKSEKTVRREFEAVGLPVRLPWVNDVEAQIRAVYKLLKEDRLLFFDDLSSIISDMEEYSREVDDEGNPTDEILNKSSYHLLDALRYIAVEVDRLEVDHVDTRGMSL